MRTDARSYQVLSHQDLEGSLDLKQQFALDVLMGLSEQRKTISSKYFYDDEGSRLFQKITQLPEYYLTGCEFEIFQNYREEIADLIGDRAIHLIELGPGDGHKTNILLEHFLDRKMDFRYVPIDISESAMKELVESLFSMFPNLDVNGVVSEYFNGIKWLNKIKDRERTNFVLFMGSNIGNFNRARSRVFLRSLWNVLNHNDFVLIGFDLKKDIEIMLRAYNDSEGITRDFNVNLLRRINRELGSNFNIAKFDHFSHYDVFSGAMESYLVSREAQTVFIQEIGQSFSFQAWEPIHTEYSYKYLESDIQSLAQETGFIIEKQFYDSKRYFTDSIWRVNKPSKQLS